MRITLIHFGKCVGSNPGWYFDILTFNFSYIHDLGGNIYPLFAISKQNGKITLNYLFFIKTKYGTE